MKKMLDVIPYDRDPNLCKRHVDVRDIDIFNKHLTDQQERHMGEDEKPVTNVDITLNFLSYREVTVRSMIRKHEHMWCRQPGQINVSEMRIEMVLYAKPFKSPPYRVGSEKGNLKELR